MKLTNIEQKLSNLLDTRESVRHLKDERALFLVDEMIANAKRDIAAEERKAKTTPVPESDGKQIAGWENIYAAINGIEPPRWEVVRKDGGDPLRLQTNVASERDYASYPKESRFHMRVLHAAGIDTAQLHSNGHDDGSLGPTIDLPDEPGIGLNALAALEVYGLRVAWFGLIWTVSDGLPYQRFWRVVLKRPCPERADERPGFIVGVMANVES